MYQLVDKPHQYSVGFRHVVVNGEVVINDGKHTELEAGKMLLGPG